MVSTPGNTSQHREVVSRGSHHSFVRPSDGCADAKAPVAGPDPAIACRPPSAPCGDGAGPTSWTAIPVWQPLDGHALPTRRTGPVSRRPPRMGTRHPIPLLPTGKPLRGTTPKMMMIGREGNVKGGTLRRTLANIQCKALPTPVSLPLRLWYYK